MFYIIGECINTSRKKIKEAVDNKNAAYIQEEVKKQEEAGADFLDVNAGMCIGYEIEAFKWLLDVIQEAVNIPLCLDSPSLDVLEIGYKMAQKPPIINSISLEKNRLEPMLNFLKGKDCKVIGLCMDDAGMPADADDTFQRARRLVEMIEDRGIKRESIFIDPIVQPVSVNTANALSLFEATRKINKELPEVKTVCGLSNISYGLPNRMTVNRVFLSLFMGAGLSAAILDPLDRHIMAVLTTTKMLLGQDEFCAGYIRDSREGKL